MELVSRYIEDFKGAESACEVKINRFRVGICDSYLPYSAWESKEERAEKPPFGPFEVRGFGVFGDQQWARGFGYLAGSSWRSALQDIWQLCRHLCPPPPPSSQRKGFTVCFLLRVYFPCSCIIMKQLVPKSFCPRTHTQSRYNNLLCVLSP